MIRTFLRDNGLTIALLAMFLFSLGGMILSGQAEYNGELASHGRPPIGLAAYATSGHFISSLFENWESEFLQMATYVVLTALLFQRGSAESRNPDEPFRPDDRLPWAGRHPVLAWVYEHSLGLALVTLFLASFVLHGLGSLEAANQEAMLKGTEVKSIANYIVDARFWFESFQNWQSEFLATAVLVVLSIVLRHRGSPESKPVAASNAQTGA
jgi:membrane protein implicated in regulation of membrane protease activity